MSKVLKKQDVFAPRSESEFVSGEVVEPGVYADADSKSVVILHQADTLPEEVRIVRTQRRFQRFENLNEAYAFLEQQETLRRAA